MHAPRTPITKNPTLKRFGFAGFCFGVAFICWAIQKGDAAVNPNLSWSTGLFWYSVATLMCVVGIWLWDRSADRHILIRGLATGLVLLLAYWTFHEPVMRQYRKEHPRVAIPGAPTGEPQASIPTPHTEPIPKTDAGRAAPKPPILPLPKSGRPKTQPAPKPTEAVPVPTSPTPPYGLQHNEPGSVGYQANGPGAHAGPIYNAPTRIMVNCVPVQADGPFEGQIAYIDGKPVDVSIKQEGTIFVVVRMSDTTRYRGAPKPMLDAIESLSSLPSISVLGDFTRRCGYALRTKAEVGSIGPTSNSPSITYFKPELRDRAEELLRTIGDRLNITTANYFDPQGGGSADQLRRADFFRLSGIDIEIIF